MVTMLLEKGIPQSLSDNLRRLIREVRKKEICEES